MIDRKPSAWESCQRSWWAAIAHVESLGYELVDVSLDDPDWKEAFMRPSRSHGTLIQLAQPSGTDEDAAGRLRPSNLEDLLG